VQTAATSAVAVVDTGIDLTHPDLNAAAGKNCITSGAAPNDDNGHGSHVSGTIAARNNGSGVVGAVPGTKLYAVKVLNAQGSGSTSTVVCGIDWVTANASALGIKVANMSLGGSGTPLEACGPTMTDAEHKAICNAAAAGVTFVVAAGNSGWDFDHAAQPDVPAAYPEVLTVSAMSDSDGQPGALGGAPSCRTSEADDRYASFSNYALTSGGIAHTIAGPGVCIRSTWMNGGYNTISGTSMATPNVAGIVAACLDDTSASGCAGKAPAQVIQQMRANAQSHATTSNGFTGDPFHVVSGRYYGYLAWGGVTDGTPPPAGDFSLSATPSSVTAPRSGSGTTTIAVSPINGFTGSVTLSSSCSARVSCSFAPNPTTGQSTMTLAPNRKARTGTYQITVTGASNGLSHQTQVTLTVQ
jgi:subtilisin family serine protease